MAATVKLAYHPFTIERSLSFRRLVPSNLSNARSPSATIVGLYGREVPSQNKTRYMYEYCQTLLVSGEWVERQWHTFILDLPSVLLLDGAGGSDR